LRFRPILMTSLAFILGVSPLAFSTGAGAGARISAGTGVMGGMLAATFLAIFFVPMFFKLIADRRLTEPRSTAEIRAEIDLHKKISGEATIGVSGNGNGEVRHDKEAANPPVQAPVPQGGPS